MYEKGQKLEKLKATEFLRVLNGFRQNFFFDRNTFIFGDNFKSICDTHIFSKHKDVENRGFCFDLH